MSKIAKIVTGLVSVLAIASLAAFANWQPMTKQVKPSIKSNAQSTSVAPRAMTLLEAWDTSSAYGKTWQTQAAIASIQSFDVSGDTTTAGQDGHRRGWIVVFISQNASLWLRLVDGVIVDQTVRPLSPDFLALSRPNIDSPEALVTAQKAKPSFEASDDERGQGFHFALENTLSGATAIAILGSYDGAMARVSLDASTGALLESEVRVIVSGGILYSRDKGKTWQPSDLQNTIVSIAPDPLTEDKAYALSGSNGQMVIYQTDDGGEHWSLFSDLPSSMDGPFDLEVVDEQSKDVRFFVGTWTGVWTSTGGDWTVLSGLPTGPKQWLAAASSPTGYRLFVSITAGVNRGLYASTDLSTWEKLSSDVLRLSRSFDGRNILATNEEQGGAALLLNTKSKTDVQMAEGVLRAAGDFGFPERFIIQSTARGVGPWSASGEPPTLSIPIASLAAAKDFPSSQMLIAGGFRSGIYQSRNGGRSWELVLANPSKIVPGSNEISDVMYLSTNSVIAVNGGIFTWTNF